MTTPAHCTRTDPHPAHEDRSDLDIRMPTWCPGVEPPADVQATPDPRCNRPLVRMLAGSTACQLPRGHKATNECPGTPDPRVTTAGPQFREDGTRRGTMRPSATPFPRLDVLGACPTRWRAKGTRCERHADGWHRCDGTEHVFGGHECLCGHDAPTAWLGTSSSETYTPPAPAGLTPAQEIRLRLIESCVLPASWGTVEHTTAALSPLAAWVEHGDDGTPDSDRMRWRTQVDRLAQFIINNVPGEPSRSEGAVDTAVRLIALYQARLGHIADALRDWSPKSDFGNAVRDALAWTPDDTRCARCGADWPVGAHGEGFCVPTATDSITGHTVADVQRMARAWVERNDTTPKEAPDGGE